MPPNKPRAFVAGCRGQLGRDLLQVLDADFTVSGMDIPELDIADADSLQAALRTAAPDVIINAAAFTDVDACETQTDAARRANVEGPRRLARWAAARGALLIHVSTDYVFDGRRPAPDAYREADRPAPLSAYGRTKLDGELAIRAETDRWIIARTAWLYGAHGRNFAKTMLRLALQDAERVIRVVNDQHGSPTWSWRLAEQLAALARSGRVGLYHTTGESHCTWFEFAKTFLEAMRVPHRLEPCDTAAFPRPAPRPHNSILENAALKAAGLNRMRDWDADVALFVERHRTALIAEARRLIAG